MARVVQIVSGNERRVALVDEPVLRLLEGVSSVHAAATMAIWRLRAFVSLGRSRMGMMGIPSSVVPALAGSSSKMATMRKPCLEKPL